MHSLGFGYSAGGQLTASSSGVNAAGTASASLPAAPTVTSKATRHTGVFARLRDALLPQPAAAPSGAASAASIEAAAAGARASGAAYGTFISQAAETLRQCGIPQSDIGANVTNAAWRTEKLNECQAKGFAVSTPALLPGAPAAGQSRFPWLLVLGAVVVVGGGAAIYFATRDKGMRPNYRRLTVASREKKQRRKARRSRRIRSKR